MIPQSKKAKDEVNAKVEPKVIFAQLMEKYQKINEAKSVYRPIVSKASRSPPRSKSKDRYWQRDNLNTSYSHPYCGLPIPMSWVPPYAYMSSYPSWEGYDTRAHYPSYFESSQQGYVAPKRSAFNKHNQDRFTQKESARFSWRKKEVVQQVYQVKRDGRKDVV